MNKAMRGFSLVELLVVVAIIAILVGILIPVVSSVRKAAREADVRQQLSTLASAIEQYRMSYNNTYPGPLANNDIGPGATTVGTLPVVAAPGFDSAAPIAWASITMSENLTLGICGGLTTAGYNPSSVGRGPQSLLASNPRQYPALLDTQGLYWREIAAGKTGKFQDSAGSASDTIIPEFVDRFIDPMPILYLRARTGAQPTSTDASLNPIMTNNTPAGTRPGQYDISQIIGYTGTSIGVGRSVPQAEYDAPATFPNHGLRTVTFNAALASSDPNYQYPWDAYPYFKHPTLPNIARQKDGFILISAGTDRVYGTKDDITSFGNVQQ